MAMSNNEKKIIEKIKEIVAIESLEKNHTKVLSEIFEAVLANPNQTSQEIAKNFKNIIMENK